MNLLIILKKHSSYQTFFKKTYLVVEWFGDIDNFKYLHSIYKNNNDIDNFLIE